MAVIVSVLNDSNMQVVLFSMQYSDVKYLVASASSS